MANNPYLNDLANELAEGERVRSRLQKMKDDSMKRCVVVQCACTMQIHAGAICIHEERRLLMVQITTN